MLYFFFIYNEVTQICSYDGAKASDITVVCQSLIEFHWEQRSYMLSCSLRTVRHQSRINLQNLICKQVTSWSAAGVMLRLLGTCMSPEDQSRCWEKRDFRSKGKSPGSVLKLWMKRRIKVLNVVSLLLEYVSWLCKCSVTCTRANDCNKVDHSVVESCLLRRVVVGVPVKSEMSPPCLQTSCAQFEEVRPVEETQITAESKRVQSLWEEYTLCRLDPLRKSVKPRWAFACHTFFYCKVCCRLSSLCNLWFCLLWHVYFLSSRVVTAAADCKTFSPDSFTPLLLWVSVSYLHNQP